jgi:succinate dehydrogenase / fumarate reductase membrane anchor subunit
MAAVVKQYTRTPVGAHYGMRGWLLQRLTALFMALYTVGLLACLLWHAPAGYAEWKAIFAGEFTRIATMGFFAALLYHAWIGMRDILMDYVKPAGLRLTLQAAVAVTLAMYLIWSAAILWGGPA